MSSNLAGRYVRTQTSSIIATTVFFLVVALVLTGLVAHVVITMTRSANEIDDARASRAARAAIGAFVSRLSATTTDNAVWDDAYSAVSSSAAADWAYENWGKTSEDYALYDGAIVIGPDRSSIVSAYAKGKPFQPSAFFGEGFYQQINVAADPGRAPVVNFIKTESGIALIASQAIQPFEATAELPKPSTLSFYKEFTSEVLDTLSNEHELEGLHLETTPKPEFLNTPITDLKGAVIGYLVWPSKAPGTAVFHQVYPYVAAAIVILALFLIGVLLVGASEARRLRQLAQTAIFEADHDNLSGLLNRHGLLNLLEELDNSSSSPHRLYLVDLDGFKAVNDAWGHAVGDDLIRLVSKALTGCHPEIIATARLGGDEFALVHVGSAMCGEMEKTILALFAEPFKIDGRTIEVGASIGAAVRNGDVPPLELLRRADMALYRAKANGRGQAIEYDPELDRERQRVAELEGLLKSAISSGAIEAVFQPLVSATTGAVTGLEALARWRTATGNISPEIFIPLAERCGLIDALGVHMLRTSIEHAKSWPDLALSVNVSPIQLCNPEFAAEVISVLRELDFSPRRLTLEITEGVLMTNPDQARRSIDQLKRVGIKFALDDFGCGYASIGALRQFGFDRMKIDRSLVSALDEGGNGADVLRATISLATALQIPVTAEGIENTRQATILRDAGCDQLQGYLIGRPMSAHDISSKLEEESAA
ncbi:bifunctional diguanylate cyclase/phosphodiesterase [Rhizobium ruizarguesonis]|jgi:diguanylate cyclase (GGDEF)-like protein|uniref:bifunctional diguanylate cyclase/phosphodiesterase n=1 Tax=Rhizobium ruizarguesonis TaxID=2081791 RepID=UPI00103136B5|nr:bifunctional diguanylate cyclase/phosphodiesterase [Rhizobium ruizarguesonis]MBY5853723.1 bifunctional diguanylate cyclase/phosphodiesterase [Rhizobium leguminosarum]MBY5885025.1 bifunctional diguanylate cyclase/phosphodiesterase [Rhizobium leguminosarum]QSZ02676.1 bifunctional diguanylate cyclase/phosphodiesterase [Rhizobium ruizarguesonis]TAU04723.1 bifunctional diguanylate cyclase/phosphodiesterase [Rhizobium ruizarguesonis]TAY78760.1 bifunctional diguanylate cyclase/phosphodiesterase [R